MTTSAPSGTTSTSIAYLDLLYLAGLGEVAASALPRSNVIDLVARMAKRSVNEMVVSGTLAA